MSVLVFAENWDGKFKKISYELVSYANKIAEDNGSEVVALSIGNVADDELRQLAKYGAKKIVSINREELHNLENRAYTAVISQVAESVGAGVVVFAHNNTGKALAPRVSVKLKAGLVTGVVDLPSGLSPFTIKKKAFTGGAIANVQVKSGKAVVTLAPNTYELIESQSDASVDTMELQFGEIATKVNEVNKVTGKILLSDAEIVVSGGRGMKNADQWGPLEELAAILGAGLACSRPVSDEGWRPHEEHVGQTGKIIAPNLYFALGISGAIQHLGGVSSSKCIVAVNTDKDAPIFEAADYGIIGDVRTVIPAMIEAFKSIK